MPPKPRAVWTSQSDAILLEVLMRERDDGKQTSNGNWHADAWSAAQTALSGTELLTGGCTKTSASCQYRWNALKKEYKEVNHIRGLSGFGWDNIKKVVTAGPEVWDALIKAHPTYKKWLTHSFPLFDEMQDLIEGTYATGQSAFHPHSTQPSKGVGLPDDPLDEESNDPNIDPSLFDKPSPSPSSLSQSSTPSFSTSSAPSASPDPASSLSKKRDIPDQVDVPLAKHLKHEGLRHGHGHKPSAMVGPSIPLAASPEHKKQAICLVEDDGDLSEEEMIQVLKLVCRDTSFADTILAIQKKQRHTNYIKSELSSDDL